MILYIFLVIFIPFTELVFYANKLLLLLLPLPLPLPLLLAVFKAVIQQQFVVLYPSPSYTAAFKL